MTDKNVNLVIRARDQASRAIEGVAGALQDLLANQGALGTSAQRTQSDLARLAGSIIDVERAFGAVAPVVDRATASVERQRARLGETQAELTSIRQQAENAVRAIASAQTRIIDTVLAGGETSGLITQVKAAETALVGLEAQERRLAASVKAQEVALGQSRIELQKVASVANAADAALQGVGASANFEEQARAAQAVAAAARSIGDAFRDAAAQQAVMLQQARAVRGIMDIETRTDVSRTPATSAGAGFSALDEQARAAQAVAAAARAVGEAEDQAAVAAQRLRDRTDPLAAIQRRLNEELAEARTLYRQNKISAEELANAEQFLAREAEESANALGRVGRGERGRPSLFGLKPYELTNLGYQVNDVVTQLASGTSLTQTLAQQGGQLLQLFPRLGAGIVAALGNPVVIGAAAAFGTIVIAVRQAVNEAQRLRDLRALLVEVGAGAGTTATELNEIVKTLDRLGLSATTAQGVVSTLVRNGLDPARIQQFGIAARDAADALGIDAADAAQKLAEGLTGGYDAIVRMSDGLNNILRPAELENIRLQFEAGQAGQARANATRIVSQRLEEAARQSRGPWADATRRLSGAWDNFTQTLGNFVARQPDVQQKLTSLVNLIEALGRALDGVRDSGELNSAIIDKVAQIRNIEQAIAGSPEGSDERRRLQLMLAEARRVLAELQGEQRRSQPQGDPRDANSRAAEQERIDLANQRNRALSLEQLQEQYDRLIETDRRWGEVRDAANRIAIAGQIEYKRRIAETEDVRQANLARELAETRERARIGAETRQIDAGRESQSRGQILSTAQRFIGRDENVPRDRNILMELFRAGGQNIDPRIVAWCAAFVNAVLAANGLQGTGSNMARSFENFGEAVSTPQAGDLAVFRRGAPGSGQGHVGFFTRFDRNGNPVIVSGNAGGGQAVTEQAFDRRDLIGFRRIPSGTGGGPVVDFDLQRVEAQATLNAGLDREAEQRRRATEELRAQLGLSGEQLLAEQRRQAIADAIFQAERTATDQGLSLDDERRRSIEQTVGALFDLQNAQQRATQGVDLVSAERQALLSRLEAARQVGDNAVVAEVERQLAGVDQALQQAIERAIAFWREFNTPEARAAITGLQGLRDGIGRTRDELRQQTLQQPIDQLTSGRDSLREAIQFFRDQGQSSVAEELRSQLGEVDEALIVAIDRMIQFWQASSRPEAQATILQLQNLRNEVVAARNEFAITAGEIQQSFADGAVSAFDQFAQSVAEGRNVFRSLGEAAVGFAAGFLRDIGTMILRVAALKLALKLGFGNIAGGINNLLGVGSLTTAAATLAASGGSVTAGGAAVSAGAAALGVSSTSLMAAAQMLLAANSIGSAGIFHGGGTAGRASRTRSVWPGVFAAAARYHQGGIAGLKPGEVPAILERGERVLSKSQVRQQLAAGMSAGRGGGGGSLRNVLVLDQRELAAALQSREGEQVVMTHVRRNMPEIAKSVSDGSR